ncbi:alkylated DNA repair protein alkB [Thraustotheca clavata]|uniref:Alkylated DNA repair protein alkB n=1 Tax=Thraustotheca clavata TaxID=74557 RepID=A0A1W0A9A8_9STRA|nr:alkylated DNA repair protein alkB [Thraustotheca clavata]
MSVYKAVEKKWKRVKTNAILDERGERIEEAIHVIDPHALTMEQSTWIRKVDECIVVGDAKCVIYAITLPETKSCNGFYILVGALDACTQRDLAEKCLIEYAEAPHTTNLHPLNQQIDKIWMKATSRRQNEPDPMNKLHWAALGYHYNWTLRAYPEEQGSHIPELLQKLGEACANAVGFEITSEAALVNYYKANSTMGGHQDNVEITFDHPVVSFSIGSDAIFLKGGLTKDEVPIEILLRSGDVVVMGGESRLCFHGIAKTMPNNCIPAFPKELPNCNVLYHNIQEYVCSNRLNINVRQVFPTKSDQESDRKRHKSS